MTPEFVGANSMITLRDVRRLWHALPVSRESPAIDWAARDLADPHLVLVGTIERSGAGYFEYARGAINIRTGQLVDPQDNEPNPAARWRYLPGSVTAASPLEVALVGHDAREAC